MVEDKPAEFGLLFGPAFPDQVENVLPQSIIRIHPKRFYGFCDFRNRNIPHIILSLPRIKV
jgi:hypothetical protein